MFCSTFRNDTGSHSQNLTSFVSSLFGDTRFDWIFFWGFFFFILPFFLRENIILSFFFTEWQLGQLSPRSQSASRRLDVDRRWLSFSSVVLSAWARRSGAGGKKKKREVDADAARRRGHGAPTAAHPPRTTPTPPPPTPEGNRRRFITFHRSIERAHFHRRHRFDADAPNHRPRHWRTLGFLFFLFFAVIFSYSDSDYYCLFCLFCFLFFFQTESWNQPVVQLGIESVQVDASTVDKSPVITGQTKNLIKSFA